MSSNHFNVAYIYFRSIAIWVIATCTVGYAQMRYTVNITPIEPFYFIAPSVIGAIFGSMNGRIIVLNNQLKLSSTIDSLTRIFNYGYYMGILNNWAQEKRTFSLILMDIDHFKKINDQYGHKVGDNTLVAVSELITEIKRSYDVFARHGGEEFVLLTPRTSLSEAVEIAKRLCDIMSASDMPSGNQLTCSFGVAQFKPDTDTGNSLFERADKALYQSKKNGRNRVSQEEA